jgi:hypothetical protein
MTESDEYNQIIEKLLYLQITQRQEIQELLERQEEERRFVTEQLKLSKRSGDAAVKRDKPVRPNSEYADSKGQPLAVGDTVRLLTTAGTGKKGELGVVVSFIKRFVRVELLNKVVASRASKNLELIL